MKTLLAILLFLFASVAHAQTICPPGTGLVPAYPPYSNQDYCMMTREAVHHTIAGTLPWNHIDQAKALAQCDAAFVQGDLPVNALWQAFALQAEQVPENWSEGRVGEGKLATNLKLPNGHGGFTTFWHMGDGHWEFVVGVGPEHDEVISGFVYELAGGDPRSFSVNGLSGNARFHFGSGDTYGPEAQLGVTTNRASGYIMRGGDDEEPGVFGTAINHAGNAASDVSYRCVCALRFCGVQ